MHIPDTKTLLLITLAWAVAAYLIVPKLWAIYFRHRPFFAELDRCTQTGDGHPGDPINIEIDVLARYLQRMEHYRAKA